MIAMKYTALVTVAAVLLTYVLGLRVSALRRKHDIDAPATTGHPEFERGYRAHQNTIEQLVVFLPLLWLAGGVLGDVVTALIGAVWVVGRAIYASTYTRDAAARVPGMIITALPFAAALFASLWGIAQGFMG